MYRFFFPFIFLSATLFYSCNSKGGSTNSQEDISKIAESYALIHASFRLLNKVQNNFFGKAADILEQIKYDKKAIADTRELEALLDSAKEANETQISIITVTGEPDPEIKYKEKALRYVNLLKGLYDNEFPQFITVLNSNIEDRYEKSRSVLYAKMKEMSNAMHDCSDAENQLREKYNLQDEQVVN